MHVLSLHIYPIKSTHGHKPGSARVAPWGLLGDRRWMLVDRDGVLISARTAPRLFHVRTEHVSDGAGDATLDTALIVRAPGMAPLRLTAPEPAPVPVTMFRDSFAATPVGPEADAWFREVLDRDDVRLVWLDDPGRRPTDPKYSAAEDRVSLADGYPLLLTTTASLARLNEWVAAEAAAGGEPPPSELLPMQRFRPNLIVEGALPFAEDAWGRIRVGAVHFRVVKPCVRCVMTTFHPETLAKGKEPLRTLARRHAWGGGAAFGMNIIPDQDGTIFEGDEVEVLSNVEPGTWEGLA